MTDFTNLDQAAAAANNPATSPADLAAIAQNHPSLRAKIAAHPNAYPDLLTWLQGSGDPAAAAAVAARQQGAAIGQAAPAPTLGAAPLPYPASGPDGATAVAPQPAPAPPVATGPTAYPASGPGASFDLGALANRLPLGLIALVCGIVGFVVLIPGVSLLADVKCLDFGSRVVCEPAPPAAAPLAWLTLLTSVAAIALGIVTLVKGRRGAGSKGMAITAIVLGGLGFIGCMISFITLSQTIGS